MCIQILVVRRRQFRGDFPLIEPLKIRVLAMASRSLARWMVFPSIIHFIESTWKPKMPHSSIVLNDYQKWLSPRIEHGWAAPGFSCLVVALTRAFFSSILGQGQWIPEDLLGFASCILWQLFESSLLDLQAAILSSRVGDWVSESIKRLCNDYRYYGTNRAGIQHPELNKSCSASPNEPWAMFYINVLHPGTK